MQHIFVTEMEIIDDVEVFFAYLGNAEGEVEQLDLYGRGSSTVGAIADLCRLLYEEEMLRLAEEAYAVAYMPLESFVAGGFLQEVNREWFHPLGLSLVFQRSDEGEYSIAGVNETNDPDGFIFDEAELDGSKADVVAARRSKYQNRRQARLGFGVQPVPGEVSEGVGANEVHGK